MKSYNATLTGAHNYFEDFTPGDLYEHARGKTVTEFDNVIITNLVMNTAQVHFNEHLASTLPYKRRIVFGGVTAALIIGLAMQDTGENALLELGLDKMRFTTPVFHGDTLYAFSEVLAVGEPPAGMHITAPAGEVRFRHWGLNQAGKVVFEAERRVLVKRRPPASSAAG
jgi:itaconyl-CoA hydratase